MDGADKVTMSIAIVVTLKRLYSRSGARGACGSSLMGIACCEHIKFTLWMQRVCTAILQSRMGVAATCQSHLKHMTSRVL